MSAGGQFCVRCIRKLAHKCHSRYISFQKRPRRETEKKKFPLVLSFFSNPLSFIYLFFLFFFVLFSCVSPSNTRRGGWSSGRLNRSWKTPKEEHLGFPSSSRRGEEKKNLFLLLTQGTRHRQHLLLHTRTYEVNYFYFSLKKKKKRKEDVE